MTGVLLPLRDAAMAGRYGSGRRGFCLQISLQVSGIAPDVTVLIGQAPLQSVMWLLNAARLAGRSSRLRRRAPTRSAAPRSTAARAAGWMRRTARRGARLLPACGDGDSAAPRFSQDIQTTLADHALVDQHRFRLLLWRDRPRSRRPGLSGRLRLGLGALFPWRHQAISSGQADFHGRFAIFRATAFRRRRSQASKPGRDGSRCHVPVMSHGPPGVIPLVPVGTVRRCLLQVGNECAGACRAGCGLRSTCGVAWCALLAGRVPGDRQGRPLKAGQ